MSPATQQRLRLTFVHGEPLKYLAHLDAVRLWERALRRAGLPLAYSHGFHPQPRIIFAAPLPVGFTGEAEVLDVWFEPPVAPVEVAKSLKSVLPRGIKAVAVKEVALNLPSLPSQLRASEYRVTVESGEAAETVEGRLRELLAAESLSRQRRRHKGKWRKYDLRPLIRDLRLAVRVAGGYRLEMRLRTDSQATGRPDEVLKALELSEGRWAIHRTRLLFAFDK